MQNTLYTKKGLSYSGNGRYKAPTPPATAKEIIMLEITIIYKKDNTIEEFLVSNKETALSIAKLLSTDRLIKKVDVYDIKNNKIIFEKILDKQ